MNAVLWVVQGLLAAHTVIGAVWKLSNPAQSLPSLAAIPPGAWTAMSVVEVLCGVALLLPALDARLAPLAPIAAGLVAAEMLLFCALHLGSGDRSPGQPIYWLVVVAVCALVVLGRLSTRIAAP